MATGIVLEHPLAGLGTPTDNFGWRSAVYGLNGILIMPPQLHTGKDWAAPEGTPVYAMHAGRVNRVWFDRFTNGNPAGGNMLQIGAARISTRYAHLSRYAVSLGATVQAGDLIGYVGTTGASTGAHLHAELLMPGGQFVDPGPYISASKPALAKEIDMAKGTFITTSPKGSWWYTDGMTRRVLAPGENQLMLDLGIVDPVKKPGGVHLISTAQLARIPEQTSKRE